MINSRSGQKFERRTEEITDEEILRHYGQLIASAISAFLTDVTYLVDMATRANTIESKRAVWEGRRGTAIPA